VTGRRRLAVIAGLVAVAAGAMEIWTRQPVGNATPALDLPEDVSTLVLVIHGSADADNPLLAEIVAGLAARYRDVPGAGPCANCTWWPTARGPSCRTPSAAPSGPAAQVPSASR
jgi:hypothetical protein